MRIDAASTVVETRDNVPAAAAHSSLLVIQPLPGAQVLEGSSTYTPLGFGGGGDGEGEGGVGGEGGDGEGGDGEGGDGEGGDGEGEQLAQPHCWHVGVHGRPAPQNESQFGFGGEGPKPAHVRTCTMHTATMATSLNAAMPSGNGSEDRVSMRWQRATIGKWHRSKFGWKASSLPLIAVFLLSFVQMPNEYTW